jgi:hypothetical protein
MASTTIYASAAAAEPIILNCNPLTQRDCKTVLDTIDRLTEDPVGEVTTRLKKNKKTLKDFVRDQLGGEPELIDLVVREDGTFEGVVARFNPTERFLIFNGRAPRPVASGDTFLPVDVPTFVPGEVRVLIDVIPSRERYNQLPELDSRNVRIRPPVPGLGSGCRPTPGNQIPIPCEGDSPIVLDLGHSGFSFSSLESGVLFDIDGDGALELTAWTTSASDDAFLALDRNGNGIIDGGRELFGDATLRENGKEARNGYQVLRELDSPDAGGNRNSRIDPEDEAYWDLELWTDANHNGISDPGELQSLTERGVVSISLLYRPSSERDEHGNRLKFFSTAEVTVGGKRKSIATTDVFFRSAEFE